MKKYIITEVNILSKTIESNVYLNDDTIENIEVLFQEKISEHLWNYYKIATVDIFYNMIIDKWYILRKQITEDTIIEVFLYYGVKVYSMFQLKQVIEIENSVETIEFINII